MTRMLLRATIAFGLLLGAAQPVVLAGSALIETTAPLADRSEASVKVAVIAAIDKAVRGAVAMGFPWFQLRDAQIAGDEVAIQILATDEEPSDAVGGSPGEIPDATEEEPSDDPIREVPSLATSRLHI